MNINLSAMYLELQQEDLEKQRINRFLIISLASALLIAMLLVASVLMLPDAAINRTKIKEAALSGGPIQTSLTMISSLDRLQHKRTPKAEAEAEVTAAAGCVQNTTAEMLLKAFAPLVKTTTSFALKQPH